MEGNTLTLRIKKIYLNQIREKTKRVEYRKDSCFYRAVFTNKKKAYKFLRLHYQNPKDVLIVKIKDIKLIKKPLSLKNSIFLPTPKVWAIYIEN